MYKSSQHIYAQIISSCGTKTIAAASSVSSKMKNGGNVEAASKVGDLIAQAAKKAKVSTTAFYRHFKKKDDLKAELMRRGYELINEGRKDVDTFAGYGAHYIRFGLDYPFIYDLMFGNTDLDMSLYPDLEEQSNAAFDGVLEALKDFMPDSAEKDTRIKAINIWASVHGLVGLLRNGDSHVYKSEDLKWIENNLEEYLQMTTFS